MSDKISSFVKPHNINKSTVRLSYIDQFKHLIQDGDIYEFGVYSGISIHNILQKYKEYGFKANVWGFDSFEGLPQETKEPVAFPVWSKGEFNSCEYLDVNNPTEASEIIKKNILNDFPEYQVEMIVGFYEESLKTAYNHDMKPASWLDIDVDLYSSTIEALEFMVTNKLLVNGTLVYFDDWKGTSFGEGRAYTEICNKYGIKMERLIGDGELLFRVTSG